MRIRHINSRILYRLPIFAVGALLFNTLFFLLIQQLVTNEQGLRTDLEPFDLVDFIRMARPAEIEELDPEEEMTEPEPEKIPPETEPLEMEIEKPAISATQFDIAMPAVNVPMSLNGTPFIGDFIKSTRSQTGASPGHIYTNVVPTLRVPPVYPPRALRSGIEGIVTVEFTISTDGSVKDASVVKSRPPKIFDRAVLTAISKWKFNPDIVNGKKVAKRARQDVNFKLQR